MKRTSRARVDPTLLATLSLAAFRLTRLVTTDSITEPWRQQVWNRWPPSVDRARMRWNGQRLVERAMAGGHIVDMPAVSKLGQLIACDWCAGAWSAVVVVGLAAQLVDMPLPVLTAAAVATLVGFLGEADHALAQ